MEQRLKLNTQIYEEACEWFMDSRAGDLDDAARSAFDCWLRKSPEHLRAYLEIAAIWDEGLSLDPKGKFDRDTLIAQAALDHDNVVELPSLRSAEPPRQDTAPEALPEPPPPSEVSAESRLLSGISSERRPAPRPGFRRRHLAAAAACLVAALGAGLAYLGTHQPPTYAAAIGEQRSLTLADGSTVELNSRSKMIVRYSKRERRVELVQGQALFRVAKDAARPFIVKTGDTLVRAVGTEFDINQKRAGTVVTVVEGRVAILTEHVLAVDPGAGAAAPSDSNLAFPIVAPGQVGNIMVAAGEQLMVTPKVIQIAEHPNVANATAWTQRRLVFESASLADVADEFNRYNDRQLIVADPRLETFHVSGVFSSTDPASLIRFLRARPELHLVEMQTEIRIEKNAQ
ncbi:MAG TPA: FecR domain-containing protein [Steroidobacteraceae bacterium]|jgi:transmembrane sensor|nr:FecR domain-containing protein [Steroidobacteraceae bacterium]